MHIKIYIFYYNNPINSKLQIMTLTEFKEQLGRVDWFYNYIGNHDRYMTKSDHYMKVYLASRKSEEMKKLFDEAKEKSGA